MKGGARKGGRESRKRGEEREERRNRERTLQRLKKDQMHTGRDRGHLESKHIHVYQSQHVTWQARLPY